MGRREQRGRQEALERVREESVSLAKRWENLNRELDRLKVHKVKLNEEWHELECERERVNLQRADFEEQVSAEWFQGSTKAGGMDEDEDRSRTVDLNIGGQVFQVGAELLRQDRFSLLAATCVPRKHRIIKSDPDGSFFFDRDWWLFRLILAFLRDKKLPNDERLLRELHNEAGFYCLSNLQRQIEIKLADMKLELAEEAENGKATKESFDTGLKEQLRLTSMVDHRASYEVRKNAEGSQVTGRLPDPYGFTRPSASLY